VSTREAYMRDHAAGIAELTGSISIQSCYGTYDAAGTFADIAHDIAAGVFSGALVTDIIQLTKDKIAQYPLNPARALSEAAAEAAALVNQRIRSVAAGAVAQIGLMDTTNRGMLALGQPNDGLVPALSARLEGSEVVELAPSADHAAPVMVPAPFKQFWTVAHRKEVTRNLVDGGAGGLE